MSKSKISEVISGLLDPKTPNDTRESYIKTASTMLESIVSHQDFKLLDENTIISIVEKAEPQMSNIVAVFNYYFNKENVRGSRCLHFFKLLGNSPDIPSICAQIPNFPFSKKQDIVTAAQNNNYAVVRNKYNSAKQDKLNQALLEAIKQANFEIFDLILPKIKNPNITIENLSENFNVKILSKCIEVLKFTEKQILDLAYNAVHKDDYDALKFLSTKSEAVRCTDEDAEPIAPMFQVVLEDKPKCIHFTAEFPSVFVLVISAVSNASKCVEEILKCNLADVNQYWPRIKATPLLAAAESDNDFNTEILESLLKHGATYKLPPDADYPTVAHSIVNNNKHYYLKKFFTFFDPKNPDFTEGDNNLMFQAAKSGAYDCMTYLCSLGYDPLIRNSSNQNLLLLGIINQKDETVKFFVDNHLPIKSDLNELYNSLLYNNSFEMYELLMENEPDIFIKIDGKTYLEVALQEKRIPAVKCLFKLHGDDLFNMFQKAEPSSPFYSTFIESAKMALDYLIKIPGIFTMNEDALFTKIIQKSVGILSTDVMAQILATFYCKEGVRGSRVLHYFSIFSTDRIYEICGKVENFRLDKNKKILEATRENNYADVRIVAEKAANTEINEALNIAIEESNFEIFDYLDMIVKFTKYEYDSLCKCNNAKIIETITRRVRYTDEELHKLAQIAIMKENIDILKVIKRKRPSVFSMDWETENSNSLFCYSLINNKPNACLFLFDPDLENLLQIAVGFDAYQCVEKILDNNLANINSWTKESETALVVSIKYDRIRMLKLLLDHGADIKLPKESKYPSAVHCCVFYNRYEMLNEFMKLFDIKKLEEEYTEKDLMYFAAVNGCYDCLEILVENGLDPYIKYNFENERNSLLVGICNNQIETVQFFIDSKLKTSTDENELFEAIKLGASMDIIKLLVENEPDMNKTLDGENYHQFAAKLHKVEIVKFLLKSSDSLIISALLDQNLTNEDKTTYIEIAAELFNKINKHEDFAKLDNEILIKILQKLQKPTNDDIAIIFKILYQKSGVSGSNCLHYLPKLNNSDIEKILQNIKNYPYFRDRDLIETVSENNYAELRLNINRSSPTSLKEAFSIALQRNQKEILEVIISNEKSMEFLLEQISSITDKKLLEKFFSHDNFKDNDLNTIAKKAIDFDNYNLIQVISPKLSRINTTDVTPFVYALKYDKVKMVQILFNIQINNPLDIAARYNAVNSAKFMLNNNLVGDNTKSAALIVAIENNSSNVFDLLLEFNTPWLLDDNSSFPTAMHAAAFYNRYQMLKTLISKRSIQSPELNTDNSDLMYFAAKGGAYDCIGFLIENGMNPYKSYQLTRRYNPLMVGVYYEQIDTVKYFIDHQMVTSTEGRELSVAISNNAPLALIKLLVDNEPDLNITVNKESFLVTAIKAQRADIVKYLLKSGADINFTNPLNQCADYIEMDVFNVMLSNGAVPKKIPSNILYSPELLKVVLNYFPRDTLINIYSDILLRLDDKSIPTAMTFHKYFPSIINQINTDGVPPLIYYTSVGKESIVKLLLEDFKADPNVKDSRGQTALFYAVIKIEHKIMKLLIEHGTDKNIKNDNGDTARDKIFSETFRNEFDNCHPQK